MWLGFLVIGICSLHLVTADRDHGDTSLESILEERFNAVTRRLQLLESRDLTQQAEIESLKTELHAQKQRTLTLEKLVRLLQGKAEKIKESNESQTLLQGKTEKADKRNESSTVKASPVGRILKSNVRAGHRPKTENEILQRKRKAENEMPVAFYATLLDHHVVHSGSNQIIVFEHVITNVGNAYSSTLGAFTAPVPGIYVFSVTLTAYSAETEHYTINKNGQIVGYMYARAHESPYLVTGQTAVLQLIKGDNVEVQTLDADGSVHGSGYSSFSGFLLQQDYGSVAVVGK